MKKAPGPAEFTVSVEGIGDFTFARRNMRREIAVGVEYSRMLAGVDAPTPWLDTYATFISTLKALTVASPKGWDIDEMDALDPNSYAQLGKVYGALREKEAFFRSGSDEAVKADSP